MRNAVARADLVVLLQMAYSGERAAAYAYLGHLRSLRSPSRDLDRAMLRQVLVEEIQHRRLVRAMLRRLGAAPDPRRERKMAMIGRAIGALCLVSGWYAPMYGAGRLERRNIVEYEVAARLAHDAGLAAMADQLLVLAEVEWDHEEKFRARAAGHRLWRVSPRWTPPPPRPEIRASYAAYVDGAAANRALRWTPLR